MKRKTNWPQNEASPDCFWEEPWGLPPGGVGRDEIAPLLEDIFLRGLGVIAWRALGEHWQANPDAFAELDRLSPEGMEAMARYCSRHFLRRLPAAGITEAVFWDEYMLFMLRLNRGAVERDETFAEYLKSRIGKPSWPIFLQRFVQTLEGSEGPEFANHFLLCTLWDLYPMPLRFWADTATVDLLSTLAQNYNLDRVRNLRRELGLNRSAPTLVTAFRRLPPKDIGAGPMRQVTLDDCAAERIGLKAMFQAFLRSLNGSGKPGS